MTESESNRESSAVFNTSKPDIALGLSISQDLIDQDVDMVSQNQRRHSQIGNNENRT